MGKKGRSITLKLMVRADGADIETSKFLGHGVCDNLSRSSQLLTGTDSAELILKEVVSLAKAVGIDSDQWRGVGVSISRLEDRGEANQSLLRFLTKGKKEAGRGGKEKLVSNNAEEVDDLKDSLAEHLVEQTVFDSHSKDADEGKPDPGFLAALPPDLRAEVEAEWRQSRREAQSAEELVRIQEQNCLNKRLDTVQSTLNESVERKGTSSLSLEVESSCSKSKELQPQKASPTSTQFDPQFMAEMPADIREELEEHQRERKRLKVKEAERLSPAEASFPQLDPEVLIA